VSKSVKLTQLKMLKISQKFIFQRWCFFGGLRGLSRQKHCS